MSVCEELAARALRHGAHPAVIEGGETVAYAALWTEVEAASSMLHPSLVPLRARGLVPRVGLFCPNGVEHVVLALAVLRAGGCLVPVPGELAEPERDALVRRTGLDVVVCAGGATWSGWSNGGECFQLARGDVRVVPVPDSEARARGAFDELDPAFVRFSSGTTGESKGVVLSHRTLAERADSANRRLKLTPGDRVLWTLPMAHHFAVSILLYLRAGATTVVENSHFAGDVLDCARRHGATVVYGSPFHHAMLAAESSGRDWPSLRLAVSTAAPLPPHVASTFYARYGVPLSQGLGVIEMGLPLLNTAAAREKPGSVGRADDVAVSVRRGDGTEAGAGEVGELWMRGPGMWDAYLSPWRTRAESTSDGWFATGDLVERDGEGDVFWRGRSRSVVNVGGMKCFPEEVEAVLDRHPAVRESLVRGEPHERWGMVPVASIVLRAGIAEPRAAELSAWCRSSLAAFKVPVRFAFVPSLPRTASGKLSRRSG